MTLQKPILVTGSHRSGTTFVGQMISLSPSVFYVHEPFNWDTHGPFRYICHENEYDFCEYVNSDFYKYIAETINFSYSSHYYRIKMLERNKGKIFLKQILTVPRDWINFSIKKALIATKFLVPLVKDPLAVFSAEWLASRFDMNVVVLIRHPAAFANSLKRLNWKYKFSSFLEQELLLRDYLYPFKDEIGEYARKDYDIIDQSILLWKMIYYVISIYQKKYPSWVFIRHEDISNDPLHHFGYLFQNLNLNLTEKIKQTISKYTEQEFTTQVPDSSHQVTKRDSKLEILKWKKSLSDSEITRIRSGLEGVWNEFYSDEDW